MEFYPSPRLQGKVRACTELAEVLGVASLKPTLIEIRVRPRAYRSDIGPTVASRVTVYVTVPPEGGKANAAAVALLAERLGVARRQVAIVWGHTSRDKVVAVEGVSREDALARLRPRPEGAKRRRWRTRGV